MAIKQDLFAGTNRIDQKFAITTLANTISYSRQSERASSKEQFDYLSVVGSLLHIANYKRCDMSFSAFVLSRHVACPGQAHVNALKRVVMYFSNTQSTESSIAVRQTLLEMCHQFIKVKNIHFMTTPAY
jgi:hypothetical protein